VADGVQDSAASGEVVETVGGSPEFVGSHELKDPMRPTVETVAAPEGVPEKFWDADKGVLNTDALLASYKELESKLGQGKSDEGSDDASDDKDDASDDQEGSDDDQKDGDDDASDDQKDGDESDKDIDDDQKDDEDGDKEDAPAPLEAAIEAAREAYKETGDLSEEHRAPLIAAGISNDQIDLYLAGVRATEAAMRQAATEAAGVDDYAEVEQAIEWASKNWSAKKITAFNAQTGDVETVPLAIAALFKDYRAAEPGEGKLANINGGTNRGDVYTDRREFDADLAKADKARDGVARAKAVAKMDRSLKAKSLKN
jgi:hypothetical protein